MRESSDGICANVKGIFYVFYAFIEISTDPDRKFSHDVR